MHYKLIMDRSKHPGYSLHIYYDTKHLFLNYQEKKLGRETIKVKSASNWWQVELVQITVGTVLNIFSFCFFILHMYIHMNNTSAPAKTYTDGENTYLSLHRTKGRNCVEEVAHESKKAIVIAIKTAINVVGHKSVMDKLTDKSLFFNTL